MLGTYAFLLIPLTPLIRLFTFGSQRVHLCLLSCESFYLNSLNFRAPWPARKLKAREKRIFSRTWSREIVKFFIFLNFRAFIIYFYNFIGCAKWSFYRQGNIRNHLALYVKYMKISGMVENGELHQKPCCVTFLIDRNLINYSWVGD